MRGFAILAALAGTAGGSLAQSESAGLTFDAPYVSMPMLDGRQGQVLEVLAGRFDSDPHLDLVVVVQFYFSPSKVRVFRGRGDGAFEPPRDFDSAFTADWLRAIDLDGDHDLDLVGSSGSFEFAAMLGNGDGTFAPYTLSPIPGGSPAPADVGDVNGDTRPDIVLSRAPELLVFLGNGDGTFGAELSSPLAAGPSGITLGDFDEDGQLDVASTNFFPASVQVALGHGDGSFGAAQEFFDNGSPRGIAVGDMDRDGHVDLVTADFYSSGVSVLRGAGDGSFELPASYDAPYGAVRPVLVDLDQDGRLDVVVSSEFPYEIGVLLGRADGSLAPVAPVPLIESARFALGDADEDGNQDVFADAFYSVNVSFGGKHGTFGRGVHLPNLSAVQLATTDANGDSKADLIVAQSNGIVILPRTGPARFGEPVSDLTFVPYIERMEIADLNGDAIPDAVLGPAPLYVCLGNGLPGFEPSVAYDYGTGFPDTLYGIADADSDGPLDLLVNASGGISAMHGRGDGTFDPPAVLVASYPRCAAVADLDGDGLNDLVAGSGFYWTLELYHARAGGGFDPALVYDVPHSAFSLAVRDLDGDGRPDVVVGGASDHAQVSVLRGRADGALEPPVAYDVDTFVREIAVADFDLDGALDIASSGGTITLLRGDGKGHFGSRRDYGAGRWFGAADLDDDGRLDLAGNLGGDGDVWLLLNRERKSNAPPDCSAAVPSPAELSPADGRLVPISILGVRDPEGDALTIRVTRVTQDEPVVGDGGPNAPDAVITADGVRLRRERAGSNKHLGNGRVYALTFIASDDRGGQATGVIRVCVPTGRRGADRCIDDGQLYDSTQVGGQRLAH